MVANPGLLPSFESLSNGDVGRKKKQLAEVRRPARAFLLLPVGYCASPTSSTCDSTALPRTLSLNSPLFLLLPAVDTQIMEGCFRATHEPDERTGRAFAPDAMLANSPAFAAIHLAEALGSASDSVP